MILILCSSLMRNSFLFSGGEFNSFVVYLFSPKYKSKHVGVIRICATMVI